MNKALIDTDILSEIGKAKDATVAANAKTYRRSFGHYTFSPVSVMEIFGGFQRKQATGRLNAFRATLPHVERLPFDQPAAELAGRIGGDLDRMGQPIGVADTMMVGKQAGGMGRPSRVSGCFNPSDTGPSEVAGGRLLPGRRDQEPIVRPSRPWLGYSLRRRP